MDFDSMITVFFIIIFFVLPSIFKQIMARKKKTAKSNKEIPKKAKANPSIFDKISIKIRQFVEELEEQARQQKKQKEITEPETVWETLAQEEDLPPAFESTGEDADFNEPESEMFVPPVKKKVQPRRPVQEDPSIEEPVLAMQGKYYFKSNPLQNAIIWSEILSKPLALREK